MGSHRRLAGYVIVDGTPYGPHDDLPERIAVRITNPAAWEPDTHPTSAATGASPTRVTSPVDVSDQATGRQNGPFAPDAEATGIAVPDIAASDKATAPVTPDAAVPDEPTVTPDETASTDITAPEVDEVEAPAAVSPPPRSGKGSSVEAWRAYARAMHVPVSDGAERADIITACEEAGHLPPQ